MARIAEWARRQAPEIHRNRGVFGVNVAAGGPIPADGIPGTLSNRNGHTGPFTRSTLAVILVVILQVILLLILVLIYF